MKRYLAIPLIFLYLLAMSGIRIHAHYCGTHLMAVDFGTKGPNCGDCENHVNHKSCCKDILISYHVAHEHNFSVFNIQTAHTCNILADKPALACPFISVINYTSIPPYAPNAPPGLWQQIPLYKLHVQFTYYG